MYLSFFVDYFDRMTGFVDALREANIVNISTSCDDVNYDPLDVNAFPLERTRSWTVKIFNSSDEDEALRVFQTFRAINGAWFDHYRDLP